MCLEVSALKKGGKKMKKQQGGKRNFPAGRLLAALLSLCLLIGLVPGAQTTAFADGTDKAIVPFCW